MGGCNGSPRWQWAHTALQSVSAPPGGTSVPHGHGGGEDGLDSGLYNCTIILVSNMSFLSCRRKNILCWAFLMRELMVGSYLRSWKWKEFTMEVGESMRSGWDGEAVTFLKFMIIFTVFWALSSRLLQLHQDTSRSTSLL